MTRWRQLLLTLRGVLLELTDQNAYRRHLEHRGVSHSAEEWRRFSDERWNAAARRTRCC
jgi:hypothetical protein